MSEINLLPVGFYDVYGDKAKKTYQTTNKIIDYLLENDFELFSPSPVEYEKVSSVGSEDRKFRVLDPLSDKILTIRSDITTEVSRALSYADSDLVKVCYSAQILRLNIDKINQARSFKQTGFEIMSKDDNLDIENLVIDCLSKLIKEINLEAYSIVFSDVRIRKALSSLCNLSETELSCAIHNNDFDKIYNNSPNIDLRSMLSPKKIKFFHDKQYLSYHSDCADYYNMVFNTIAKVPKFLHESFIFDPLNFSFSNYNSGSFFTIIHNKTGKVMARGGEYNIKGWGKGCGASFYIEEIIG